ncbi:MAG: DMT family transporter [Acidimicrobiales bacterium]|nr:DMT family transporter [Acidimicrobiales bacterium]
MAPILSRFQGSIVVLICGLSFSFGPLTFRSVEEADAWQYLFWRSSSVAILSIIIICLARHNPFRAVAEAGKNQIIAGILMGVLFTLFIVSLSRATAAFVLLMQCTSPFYAAFFSRIFLKESVDRKTLTAMIFSIFGIGIMVGGNLGSGDAIGITLAAILPIFLGGYTVLIRSAPIQDPGVPVVIGGITATIVSVIVSLPGPGLNVPVNDIMMGCIGGGILIGIFAPLWNYAHRFVPAADVSLLLISEIIAAPIWLWIWMNETPTSTTLIGGGICLASVTWLTRQVARSTKDVSRFSKRVHGLYVGAAPIFKRPDLKKTNTETKGLQE